VILTLVDVAECIAATGIADRSHIYVGRMPDKKPCSIGIYNLDRQQVQNTVGGRTNSSYRIKPVSILVHWNKSSKDTELKAAAVYDAVAALRNAHAGGNRILFADMHTDTPVDVGMDDGMVYEMVIEADFYYERKD
jgi:hypothetical protein